MNFFAIISFRVDVAEKLSGPELKVGFGWGIITACTVVQAVVKANTKSNGKIVMFCEHVFLVVRGTFFIHRIALRRDR